MYSFTHHSHYFYLCLLCFTLSLKSPESSGMMLLKKRATTAQREISVKLKHARHLNAHKQNSTFKVKQLENINMFKCSLGLDSHRQFAQPWLLQLTALLLQNTLVLHTITTEVLKCDLSRNKLILFFLSQKKMRNDNLKS